MVTLIYVTLKSSKPLLRLAARGYRCSSTNDSPLTTLKRISHLSFLPSLSYFIQFISQLYHSLNKYNYRKRRNTNVRYTQLLKIKRSSHPTNTSSQSPTTLHWTRPIKSSRHRSKQGPNNNNCILDSRAWHGAIATARACPPVGRRSGKK